tara:strand:- start:289462 stop:291087 length:1626 start_codon:yes stop_codon:yes gene_type:complete
MKTNKKTRTLFAILALMVLGISWYGMPNYSYSWDSHNKLVQAWSVWQNGYGSDELFHHFANGDPEYRFFPHGANAFGKIDGRFVSAFPIALAAPFAAIWALLGPTGVLLVSSLFLVASCFVLYRFWELRGIWLFVPVLFTFLLSFTLEFNEHLIVAFLSFFGISLWLKSGRPIAGGILIGLAVFFRHETLPLLLSTGLSALVAGAMGFSLSNDSKPSSEIGANAEGNPPRRQGWVRRAFSNSLIGYTAGATGAVLAFVLFNLLLYGHPLGPRFLINAAGLEVDAATRMQWAQDLLFWHNVKPGLFGYMPALALVLIAALVKYRKLEGEVRILYLTILIYIPLVLLIVPNNGIMDWGPRYFGPILLPATVLAQRIWKMKYFGRRLVQGILFALALVTFSLNYAGLKYLRGARKATAEAIQQMQGRNADIWVFAGIDIFYYSGVEYLNRPILSLNNHSDLNDLMALLQKEAAGKKVLFLALPAPVTESEIANKSDTDEMLEMQIRNSFSNQERKKILENLTSVESDQLPPGLLYIEGQIAPKE